MDCKSISNLQDMWNLMNQRACLFGLGLMLILLLVLKKHKPSQTSKIWVEAFTSACSICTASRKARPERLPAASHSL
jgi:hypothetical protein